VDSRPDARRASAAAPDEEGSVSTFTPTPADITRAWHVIDAEGMVLGRLATEVARILRGKHKPMYTPHLDTGDHVIIVNADKVVLSSDKAEKKYAYRHTGYPGGLRRVRYTQFMSERPEDAVRKAVKGMLPKNRLGRAQISKLKVYAGPNHPHAAQGPVTLDLPGARRTVTEK
jgi:large subunit ribosomal protein L13